MALLFAVLMGALAVRSAVVRAFAEQDPSTSAMLWPNHPDVMATQIMAEVGQAAAKSQLPPPAVMNDLNVLAARAPLSPEPFLVHAAVASKFGRYEEAEPLLLAARRRDPRSAAARYLLADLYFKVGRVGPGLDELVSLARVAPVLTRSLVPALAQYARNPQVRIHLERLFRDNPDIRNPLLTELASDAQNADLVLSLSRQAADKGEPQPWQGRLLASLIAAGEIDRAYRLWRSFDPQGARLEFAFQDPESPSPFSWTFTQRTAGSAVPANGRLRVVFTGAETVRLASKIVRLSAGRHEIRMNIQGQAPSAVRWVIQCLPEGPVIAEVPISRTGPIVARFEVPNNCAAQRLELKGFSETFPTSAEFTVEAFDVKPVAGR